MKSLQTLQHILAEKNMCQTHHTPDPRPAVIQLVVTVHAHTHPTIACVAHGMHQATRCGGYRAMQICHVGRTPPRRRGNPYDQTPTTHKERSAGVVTEKKVHKKTTAVITKTSRPLSLLFSAR